MSDAAVRIKDVSFVYPKRYAVSGVRKKATALTDVSISLSEGSVGGLIGHNGAGKTTLLLLIAGLKSPSAGSVEVFGKHAASRSLLSRVGILTDRFSLPYNFKVKEIMRIFASMHRISEAQARDRGQMLGLERHADKWIRELSSGLRKRLYIAVSLMHDPDFVILDEPFAGIDPESVRILLDATETWRQNGKTVLISSHDLHELEEVIDELAVLREGRVIAEGEMSELIQKVDLQAQVEIETSSKKRILSSADPRELSTKLAELAAEGQEIIRIRTKGMSLSDLYEQLHRN